MSHDEENGTVQGNLKSAISVRVIVESVAVGAILWLATTVNQSNLAIARLQVQLTQVQATLGATPSLLSAVAQIQTVQAEHERRISQAEQTLQNVQASRELRRTGAGS